MFISTIRYVLLFTFISFLSSCKTDYSVDIYASDLFVVPNRPTAAIMMVQIPSCEIKEKYEAKILALFIEKSKAEVVDCQSEKEKSFLSFSFFAEIANDTSNHDMVLFKSMAPNVDHNGKKYEFIGIKPVFHDKFLERSRKLLNENFLELSYKDITIRFTVTNDERDEILISGNNLWVDGVPHYRLHREPIARRQSIKITLSDVMSDLILHDEMPVAFWVGRLK
jgi:hypothetical protein